MTKISKINTKACLYRILCIPTDKIYIGQSKNAIARLNAHKRSLVRHIHANKGLQYDFDLYGLEAFCL